MNAGGLPSDASYGPYMNADANCHANGTAYMSDAVVIDGFYQVYIEFIERERESKNKNIVFLAIQIYI